MRVIQRTFEIAGRADTVRIVPIGDCHVGAKACDEDRLCRVVQSVRDDPTAYWIGLGDYCDFINRNDPRFSPSALASWFKLSDLDDIARASRDRFLAIVKPIAAKCLALVEGNHETAITRHYERAIYSEIVTGIKAAAGWPDTHPLALGYAGWLVLSFNRPDGKNRTHVRVYLHHGFGGGRLAGAKALSMERVLLSHDCDLALLGHVHSGVIVPSAIETLDAAFKPVIRKRRGAFTGTFLRSAVDGIDTYAEVKGYLPGACDHVEVLLRPGAADYDDRIRLLTGAAHA